MILLDTHIWLWWINADPTRLKPEWTKIIAEADEVGVSAISCFEVAWLVQHGRIVLSCPVLEWMEKALGPSGVVLMPVTPQVAQVAVTLPEHHSDPQDRLIMATACVHRAGLISADGKFPLYAELAGLLVR